MRVLLIDPPFQRFMDFYRFYFPLGLTYLAAVLKNAGHEVLIYDADHDPGGISLTVKEAAMNYYRYSEGLADNDHPIWKEIYQTLQEFEPQAVGISVLTPKLMSAAKVATLVKKYDRNIFVFVGGEHVTVRPQDMLKQQADCVIRGEGEQATIDLVSQLEKGTKPNEVVQGIPVKNLDSLPWPALDCLKDISSYRPVDLGLMMDARGCPFNCHFCNLATIWGHRVRYHSLDRVIAEIVWRQKTYQANNFSFRNGTFTVDRKRVVEFCRRLLTEEIKIEWECLSRVDTIDEELLQVMKRSGCRNIRIGIESGSEDILRYLNKQITLKEIRKAAKILHQSGLGWSTYFMIGVPIETEETIKATLDLIAEIDPPFVSLAKFSPLPGTPMYDEIVQNGLLDPEDTDWTWAGNYYLDRIFVRTMAQDRCQKAIEEAVQLVAEHNKKQAAIQADFRLK